MKLRTPRFWPCLVVAIAIGAALVWLHTSDGYGDGAWRPSLTSSQFESYLRLTKLPHAPPIFRDLTIYPTIDHKTYVSGEYLANVSDVNHYRKFELFSDERADVRTLLATKYPDVAYTYAWWRDARVERAFWFALPICLLLAMFPTIAKAFTARVPVVVDEAKEQEKLMPAFTPADLPEQVDPVPSASAPAEPAVPVLAAGPLESLDLPTNEEEKEYQGEYYPVARQHTPKTDH